MCVVREADGQRRLPRISTSNQYVWYGMTFIHISYHTEFNYTNQRGNVWHQQELIAKNQLELISICRFEVTVNNRSELETINVILNRLELIAINKKKGEMIIWSGWSVVI